MKRYALLLRAAVVAALIALSVAVAVLPVAAENTMLISETESQSSTTTSIPKRETAPVVSYGLRVLSAREEMVFTTLCGNEITFTAKDICRAMNLSELQYITVTALPEPGKGTLFVGSMGASVGQTVSAGSLSLMAFAAANDAKPGDATFRFTVNGGGYDMTCRVCLIDKLNYTPTVALAPAVSLSVNTYKGMPLSGALSSYDPEGDEITYEVVRYARHGRLTLTDKHTGAYTYTPDEGFAGQDEFTYVVRDQYGNYSTAATVSVTVTAPPASVTFADVDDLTCAASALRITAAGIMNGTQVGKDCYFKPTEGISRAEFLVTAMNAAGITAEDIKGVTSTDFADNDEIPTAMRGYVAVAAQRGWINGKTVDGQKCFCPNETITRAEAAVILSNIIGYAKQTAVTAFADADKVPTWSMQALTSLRSLGVLVTTDGNADARATMTRGETAEWLCRTMQLMGN